MRTWLFILLCAGCELDEPGGSGIAIGNPPSARLQIALADPAPDVTFDQLLLPVSALYVEDCAGRGEVHEIDPPLQAGLRGAMVRVPLPESRLLCALGLVSDAETVLTGSASEGTFRFQAPLPRILVEGRVALTEDQPLVLELAEPGWIDAAFFGLSAGQHLEIGGTRCSADPRCARILTALTNEAGLYDDEDEDGRVSTEERERERAAGSGRGERP